MTKKLQAALEALKRGDLVILIDSEDRENEGDLVLAAEFATAEKINFLIRQACGLVCLSLESSQVDRLGIPPMVSDNKSPRKTAFYRFHRSCNRHRNWNLSPPIERAPF